MPFHLITAPEANPLPLTVSVNAAPPAAVLEGLSEPIVGPAAMVNVEPLDVTPPETTVTAAVPEDAIKLADTDAVNCVALTYVVDSAVPFQFTIAPEANPLPFTVSVNAAPPAVVLGGLSEEIVGPGAMVNVEPLDVTPPETTVTEAVPEDAIKLADTDAVNCVALTYVVDSAVPFQFTIAPEANPLPFTVSVNAAPPAVVLEGLSEEIVGPAAMVNVEPLDVTPPETTVTEAVPEDAIKLADTDAVNCVALTYVVDSAVPFQFTTAPEANPLPFTVSVNAAPPAVVLEGLSEEIVGPGAMVNVEPLDVTAPETTVTAAVPEDAIRLDDTDAVNCIALTYVVDSAVPFQSTTAPEANPVPFTVSVNAAPPAVVLEGLSELIVGPGAMVNVASADVTPPETTVIGTVPCDAIRLADTDAVNCIALTYVVDSTEPFHFTSAPEENPLPFTVSVKAAPPAVVLEGLSELIAGGGLMVNVAPLDVTPPETTVMVAVPCDAMRLADTDAVNCVAPTYVVGSADPFQSTTAPEANPLPFTVSVKAAPPAVALDGLNELMGGGVLMVNAAPPDVTPPDTTVIVAVPGDAIRPADTDAVTCVVLTYDVDSADPFQSTTAPEANPLPFTVNVNAAPPAVVLEGLSELIAGGGLTVNGAPPDVTPPETTVMGAVPGDAIRLADTDAVNCVVLT